VGCVPWGTGDPRFVVSQDGAVIREGSFVIENFLGTKIRRQLDKSNLLRLIPHRGKYENAIYTAKDIELYCEIVKSSRDYCSQHFPDASFHVILWDQYPNALHTSDASEELQATLAMKGINVHLISQIIPDIMTAKSGVYQIKGDGHPTAKANEIIGTYVTSSGILAER
jgi:hypothetical protein